MNKNRKGFTLVELIVVVTIFGVILGAILNMIKPANNVYHDADAPGAAPVLRHRHARQIQRARLETLVSDLRHVRRDVFDQLLSKDPTRCGSRLVYVFCDAAQPVLLGVGLDDRRARRQSHQFQHRGP